MNKLIAIGNLGNFQVYLNVELKECVRRFAETLKISIEDVKFENIRTFEFVDEFQSYEVYGINGESHLINSIVV